MDQYVPPLVAMTTGVVVILLCFVLRIPFFVIGLLSLVMVGYALQDHMIRFSSDYRNAISPAFFRNNASLLIISLVILMSLGFLLLKFGPKTIMSNEQIPGNRLGMSSGTSSWFGNMFGSRQAPRRSARGYDNDGDGYNNSYGRQLRSSDIERYA